MVRVDQKSHDSWGGFSLIEENYEGRFTELLST